MWSALQLIQKDIRYKHFFYMYMIANETIKPYCTTRQKWHEEGVWPGCQANQFEQKTNSLIYELRKTSMLDNNKIQLLKYGSLILFGAGTYIICRSLTCLQALKILQPRSVVYISRALKHNIRIIDKYLNHQIDITKKKLNIKEEKSTRARVKNISLFNAKVLISTECRTVNFHIYK